MIKKTLYFGNPTYLSMRDNQLVIQLPEVEKCKGMPDSFKKESERLFPIEDLGIVILDHSQITITHGLMEQMICKNVALITCDSTRMPIGLMLPLAGNATQTEKFIAQINMTDPLKKNLWQQTVKHKITNQSLVLKQKRKCNTKNMDFWANEVKSGDPDNFEGRAAAYYWRNLFPSIDNFTRGRYDDPPNNLLNYGYAVLRAVIARALVSSGLLPTLGIHHHNRYNAYCLADDIMEPYRPFVDSMLIDIIDSGIDYTILTKDIKQQLLQIPTIDVVVGKKKSPLMIAASFTTSSLVQCIDGTLRKIKYPDFVS